jgi:uncharacterized RDD family membrane protein YckC
MPNVSVQTTQQVHLDYEIAGIGERIFAFIIDAFLLIIYVIVSLTWMFDIFGGSSAGSYVIFYLMVYLPPMLYHLLFEFFWNGQSLGKRALGIKVVKMDGTRPNIGNYFLRWIFRLIDIGMTSGMGALFAILINGKGQRLGDMAAGTTVIKDQKRTSLSETMMTDLDEDYEPRYPSAANLSDHDVAIIKEVLNAEREYERNTYFLMLKKTQNRVSTKLGIEVSSALNAKQFLQIVLNDYNVLHGREG